MEQTLDQLGPVLARWLAPYVAEELRIREVKPSPRADYDAAVCAEFVSGLPTTVLNRGLDFFAKLDADKRVDSVTMAEHLSLGSPRYISGPFTTPVKIRARKLGLNTPWSEETSAEDRTVWVDRNGIATRMLVAIQAEMHNRHAG